MSSILSVRPYPPSQRKNLFAIDPVSEPTSYTKHSPVPKAGDGRPSEHGPHHPLKSPAVIVSRTADDAITIQITNVVSPQINTSSSSGASSISQAAPSTGYASLPILSLDTETALKLNPLIPFEKAFSPVGFRGDPNSVRLVYVPVLVPVESLKNGSAGVVNGPVDMGDLLPSSGNSAATAGKPQEGSGSNDVSGGVSLPEKSAVTYKWTFPQTGPTF